MKCSLLAGTIFLFAFWSATAAYGAALHLEQEGAASPAVSRSYADGSMHAVLVAARPPAGEDAQPGGRSLDQSPQSAGGMTPDSAGSFLQGTLIGWLLLGQPFQGVGMADIALVAVLAFIGLKMAGRGFRRTSGNDVEKPDDLYRPSGELRDAAPKWRSSGEEEGAPDKSEIKRRAAGAWDSLRSKPDPRTGATEEPRIVAGANVPNDFDASDFLEGAKLLYSRLQYSWAARDLKDLEPFTTPEMMDVLQAQAEEDPEASPVEVLLVNADLAGVSREGAEERARVLFSALIQEGSEGAPFDVKELWHFTHNYASDSSWRLDAIEPVNS